NCEEIYRCVIEQCDKLSLSDKVKVHMVGCMGMCAVGPVMLILPQRIFYTKCTVQSITQIIRSHLIDHKILSEYTFFDRTLNKHVPCIDDIDFFKAQVKIALRNCGVIENDSIQAYISRDGYFAIAKILKVFSPE